MPFKSTLHDIPRRFSSAASEYEKLNDQLNGIWYGLDELSEDSTITPRTAALIQDSKQRLAEALVLIRASRSRLNGALQTISCEGFVKKEANND